MTDYNFSRVVDVEQLREVVFEYLVDPRNRPEWQSSLVAVRLDDRDAAPGVGTTWTDQTMALVKPQMEITDLEPPSRFVERGTWRGVSAELAMTFVALDGPPASTRIVVAGQVSGAGIWRVPARVAALAAGRAIASDLRRAGRILADR